MPLGNWLEVDVEARRTACRAGPRSAASSRRAPACVQSRNRRSASSRTSPTTSLIRAIPSVQSLISLSQVWLYCCLVVALVCWYDSSSSLLILVVFLLEGGDAGRVVLLDLLDALVAALADLLELGRILRVGLLGLLLLALLGLGDAASHRLLGLAHLVRPLLLELA